jgi:hypothetical protein
LLVLNFCIAVVLNQVPLLSLFKGNEEGVNFYKETESSTWKRGGEYTIFVRMSMK